MQVDWGVELGADDETLELPWATGNAGPRYCDLKRHPDLLSHIDEANRFAELAEFLKTVNSATVFETAKCDVWSSTELSPEEKIFGASHKLGGYVDLLFTDEGLRFSFREHERLVKKIAELLRQVPEIPASAEFLVRRCFYHSADRNDPRPGFYITHYLFGYGSDERQARRQWAIGMKLVENALRQISARRQPT